MPTLGLELMSLRMVYSAALYHSWFFLSACFFSHHRLSILARVEQPAGLFAHMPSFSTLQCSALASYQRQPYQHTFVTSLSEWNTAFELAMVPKSTGCLDILWRLRALACVFLLGSGDSGKCTILKQIWLIHKVLSARRKQIISDNLTRGLKYLLDALPDMGLVLPDASTDLDEEGWGRRLR
ncbi:hypothetical protein B0H16DRAFT_1729813 [Mycena metata]|uniref:Uncharacterized protein n=1 Tax=Mycena metata TaxID=1033252 RepID=A0AAD7IAB8_9AGAR|nr:hypothetical protein B0H16DRAFT_1729813 [Mycena metata]